MTPDTNITQYALDELRRNIHAKFLSRIKFVIIVDSSNTSLRDNETRQMFRLIFEEKLELELNPAGGYTWPSPTQWPTHSMCPASRLPQSQFIQNGILQYDWDIFVPHKAKKFGKEGKCCLPRKFDAVVRSLLGLREH